MLEQTLSLSLSHPLLQLLYESSPLTTDDGLMLRRASMEIGAVHLVLACLSSLSHYSPRKPPVAGSQHDQLTLTATLVLSVGGLGSYFGLHYRYSINCM